jgi:hypothetical protein
MNDGGEREQVVTDAGEEDTGEGQALRTLYTVIFINLSL